MKNFKQFITCCCVLVFTLSLAACSQVDEVRTVEQADRNMSPAQSGAANVDEENSGAVTGLEK